MTSPRIRQGRRIRDAREARGWRQRDLAVAIKNEGYDRIVSQPVISNIEQGIDDVPRRMRGPITRALSATDDLPGLELDPLDEDEDEVSPRALMKIAS